MPKKPFLFLLVFAIALVVFVFPIFAETINSSVTVGNSAPTFTSEPAESPASDFNSPNNEGEDVTFVATAIDANNDDYYLLVCRNSANPTANANAAPTCSGGVTAQVCVSSATASNTEASCSISTTGISNQIVDWFAYVCDYSSLSECSSFSDGTGASGSPFHVNHAPTFTVAPVRPGANPGGNLTFTVLAANWGDTDSTVAPDTGKLLVCATAGITDGACNGTELCSSAFTSAGSNLSCTFDNSANAVKAAAVYNAYVYVVDHHNFGASGAVQGTNVGYSINNVTPVVSEVMDINNDTNITLTANSSINVNVKATVTDVNGCTDLDAARVAGNFYRTPTITNSTCTANTASCALLHTCTVDSSNTCTGPTDSSVTFNCVASLNYYTDPTDGDVTSNPYHADYWVAYVTAEDANGLIGAEESARTPNLEVLSLNAMSISASINYGSLAPNLASNAGIISAPVSITNTGNVGLDMELRGNGAGLCTDYPTCAGAVIDLAQQRWEYLNNTTEYISSTNILTNSYVDAPLNILKPNEIFTTRTGSIYWGIMIPSGQAAGTYTGTNTINAVVSDPSNW